MKIPEGFGNITPYLFVDDPQKVADFISAAFGGKETTRTMRGDTIANLMVRVGNSTLMLSQATEHFGNMSGAFYLYVEDCDASMKRALALGCDLIFAAEDMPYGDRQGGVKDPFENLWWISQRLTDGPYS